MDPNQALQEILELRLAVIGARSNEEAADAGGQLAYRLGDLDEWIKNGGFLPRAWWAGSRAAERRGYEQAITHLRDDEAFVAWMIAQSPGTSFKNDNQIGAAYLSARLTEERQDEHQIY